MSSTKPKARRQKFVSSGGEFQPFSEKLKVTPAKAPAITEVPGEGIQFFASNLKNVCRIKRVSAACWTGDDKEKKLKKPWDKADRTDEQKRVKCEANGGFYTAAYDEDVRSGKVEIDFLSPAQAKALGTVPGPSVRLCMKGKSKGLFVPVKTPQEVVGIAKSFQACVGGDSAKAQECALREAEGKGAVLAGARRRRRRA